MWSAVNIKTLTTELFRTYHISVYEEQIKWIFLGLFFQLYYFFIIVAFITVPQLSAHYLNVPEILVQTTRDSATDLQSVTVKSKHTKGKKNASFRRRKPEPTSRKVDFVTLQGIKTTWSGQVQVTEQSGPVWHNRTAQKELTIRLVVHLLQYWQQIVSIVSGFPAVSFCFIVKLLQRQS